MLTVELDELMRPAEGSEHKHTIQAERQQKKKQPNLSKLFNYITSKSQSERLAAVHTYRLVQMGEGHVTTQP